MVGLSPSRWSTAIALLATSAFGAFLSAEALGAEPGPSVEPYFCWTAEANQAEAPALEASTVGPSLEFAAEEKRAIDLTDSLPSDKPKLTGAITIGAIVELTAEPGQKRPIVSRWETVDGGRAFELGVMPDGRPFLAVSASGNYDRRAREVFSSYPLEVDKPYAVVGAFAPGERMALYINGTPVASTRTRVPERIAEVSTPLLLAARPPGQLHLDARIARLVIWPEALDKESIAAFARRHKLTQSPGPEVISFEDAVAESAGELPPVRTITRGPKYHWFGYYDKFQFDPTGRYVLSMEVDFEHRAVRPDDTIKIGMIDLAQDDRWIELGQSRAWCWQQGCMLQWRPGTESEVLWNDREGERFVCRVLDVKTGKRRTLPYPIHHVSPDGKWAIGTDVARVADMRPSYGYVGIPDPNRDVMAPADSGLYRMNLDTGEQEFLISIAEVAKIPYPNRNLENDKHYFNHIQWSPDGARFLFLNRGRGVGTRMFTAAADGSDLRLVHLGSSHYTWRDPNHILVWRGGYQLIEDDPSLDATLLWQAPNGHQTYLPGNEWIVTDTYPRGEDRVQTLYLFHVPTRRFVLLGRFRSPRAYSAGWRCDLHPRINRDGTQVCIDSPHGGNGRQLHLIDIGHIVGKEE
jgi:hypothetical protein